MKNRAVKGLALTAGAFLVAVALAASANAASGHQGSAGSSGAVTGSLPGEVLWAYYHSIDSGDLCPPISEPVTDGCNVSGAGDNLIRLINPNGAANGNLAGARPQTVCAMIYVFDDDQEMGECCGCPLTSGQLATFSVNHNFGLDWAISNFEGGFEGLGSIAIVAAAPNALPTCLGQGGACHGGCDPTNIPGYSVTTINNLLGSITHNQQVQAGPIGSTAAIFGLTEVGLFDDAGGDPTNLVYLQSQCGALIGNGTQGGICTCPTE